MSLARQLSPIDPVRRTGEKWVSFLGDEERVGVEAGER
jgi:hypothetical protein